jgi:XTP/dITP diphosphohydrolase
MKTRLLFASNNPHKLTEVRAILGPDLTVSSLAGAGLTEEIPEPFDTLEENALAKARHVHARLGIDCFSDDSGLEVDALGGAPGVRSARFAGPGGSARDNILKLLELLHGQENRKARFRAVIALILNGEEFLFEGEVRGQITREPAGGRGFGYDPVFLPDGFDQRFSEMDETLKNTISHRGRALEKLAGFLRERGLISREQSRSGPPGPPLSGC